MEMVSNNLKNYTPDTNSAVNIAKDLKMKTNSIVESVKSTLPAAPLAPLM